MKSVTSLIKSNKYTDQEVTRIVNRATDTDAMSRQAAVDASGVDKINLKQRLDDDHAEVKTGLAEIKNNILKFGGNADGVTPNDAAFTAAKAKNSSNIYFPQNSTNNAAYYFTDKPNVPYMNIYADEGVILSFPSNLGTYLITYFMNPVSVYARDRDATVIMYPKVNDIVGQLLIADEGVGEKDQKLLLLTDDLREFKYHTSGTPSAGTFYEIKPSYTYGNMYGGSSTVSTIAEDLSFYHAIGINYSQPGDYFKTGCISYNAAEVYSGLRIGAIAGKDANNFAVVSLDTNTILHVGIVSPDSGITWSEFTVDLSAILPNAYRITKNGCIMGIRQSRDKEFEFYINGTLIRRVETPFSISQIGIGINHARAAGSGFSNWTFLNPSQAKLEKSFIGEKIKGAAFGDSVTYSEGNAVTYPILMNKMLTGTRGITSANFDNFAISGQTAAQQYTEMQGKDLTPYNVVTIMVGINDSGRTNLDTFKSTIQSMIDYAKGSDPNNPRKVIIGMFEMYINQVATGHGISTDSYCEQATPYRLIIQKAAIDKGIVYVDCTGEFGRVGVDNYSDYTKDNLHPNALGQAQLAKSFVKGIIRSFTKDAKEEQSSYGLKYATGFADHASYKVVCTKKGNFVKINGLVTFSGSNTGSGVKIADLVGAIITKNIIATATVRLSDNTTQMITIDISNQILINDTSFNTWAGKTINWIALDISYFIK